MPDNGWTEYGKLVLAELESHNSRLDSIDEKLDNHVTTIEHRLTKIETNHRNTKYILGLIFTIMMCIFGVVVANYVG